jgi:transcriptional regulator of arginine metabolism
MGKREQRLERIVELLGTNEVSSQEQIRNLLLADGIDATQATVSRDLRELGVIKDETRYALPKGRRDARKAARELAAALRGQVRSAERAGTMVVLRTSPGMGQTLAVAIDQAELPACVGAVASHDTVFIATHSGSQARQLASQIKAWTKLA